MPEIEGAAIPVSVLEGSNVVLAVTGGIAAYKAADVASRLVQAGATVDVILTAGARRFIQPTTFSALTRRPVRVDLFAPWTEADAGHVSLGAEADVVLVAPASANAIARLALGLADDLLGAVALTAAAPLVVAPAMEHNMLHHPATQANLALLQDRGATLIPSARGRLASGAFGDGRLADPETIVGTVRQVLGRDGPLAGRRLVITAGPTREPIDPVRFLGNGSSGQMGYALAQAAIERGAAVRLIAGPTHLTPPVGAEVVRVETAHQMLDAVRAATAEADALIMAAAVADFRPAEPSRRKLKKESGEEARSLRLLRNPDILASVERPGLLKIGFAAETERLVANATEKLEAKRLDLIVANDAAATIGSPTSEAVLIERGESPTPLPVMTKVALAELILDRLQRKLAPDAAAPNKARR